MVSPFPIYFPMSHGSRIDILSQEGFLSKQKSVYHPLALEMSTWANTPAFLASALSKGLIDEGEEGSLAGRLLLILAYDNAVKKTHVDRLSNDPGHALSFSEGVPLESFLLELIGESKLTELQNSQATNDAMLFKDAFKGAIVRFTHFARFGRRNPIDTETTMAAFTRGMAIQCARNQGMVDEVIPLLMKNTGIFSERDVTAIFFQINNGLQESNELVNPGALETYGEGFFPKFDANANENAKRPYITMNMELRLTTNMGCTIKSSTNPNESDPFPCYAIRVNGINEKLYPAIEGSLPDFRRILLCGTILDEHPRQTPEALSAVRRLKPFWEPGDDCYDWFKPRLS